MIVHTGTPGYGLVELNGQEVVLPAGTDPTSDPSPATTTTSTPSTTTTTQGVPGVANCGGAGPTGMPGAHWACTFDDEFNGSSLDANSWVVQQTDNSGYTTGTDPDRACYLNDANTVSVSGGYLHLSILKDAAPFTCNDPSGSFSTEYEAGMVSTDNLFSQTYGAFEVSAQLPASVVAGLQETMWLWPQNATKYGSAWPASGEIDFGEFYSDYPTFDVPYIHYDEASTDPNVTGDCVINPSGFNTYGVDWQPGSIAIYLNGVQCLVDHPDPAAPLVSPEPFDQPFFLVLTQAIGFGSNAPLDGVTQFPSTTLVDWVRAWQS
jgi:beta-glucanase (GH16 family)